MIPMSEQVGDLYAPQRWGLPAEVIADLGDRLRRFWGRFRACFKTQTRDSAAHAWTYLRGLLGLEIGRNFANIARRVNGPDDDGQQVQHFMSDSPWSAAAVIQQVQAEIAATPELGQGGVLLLDESPDEKAGDQSAGAGRQHNGRLGKVEMSQVGVFLAFYKERVWTWVDGELFLPAHWFTADMAALRKRLGVPAERTFATKIELGWQMIQRVQTRGLPFVAVACDDLYGRSGWLRQQMADAGLLYMAEVPENTQVYLRQPELHPLPPVVGDPPPARVLRPQDVKAPAAIEVRQLLTAAETRFRRIQVRSTERGDLWDPFAMRRVWTLRNGQLAEEWLVIRQEDDQKYSYALSNAAPDTPAERLAWLKCVRHFVECSNQEAKSEVGWDEFQAQKFRAWEHQLALTILATWFIAQTKHEWTQTYARDAALAQDLQVEQLPALSAANVRELLQAVLPLPQLSPEEATRLVVKHLVNRAHSTASRLRAQRRARDPP
jgi:SRSO17 transposase